MPTSVHVQLEVLGVVHEAAAGLLHGEVQWVGLVEEVGVLPVAHRGLHLDHLPAHLLPDRVDIRVFTLPT